MSTFTILNRKIKKENLPEFTRYLFKNRVKDRRGNMYISERKFLSFLDVQCSKEVDMDDDKAIVKQANLMNQIIMNIENVKYIKKHYSTLKNKFGIGGVSYKVYSIK